MIIIDRIFKMSNMKENDNTENNNESLYHYTSIEVLCKLLNGYRENMSTGNMIFWASSIFTMNDPQEMRHGKEVLGKLIPANEIVFGIPPEDRLDISSVDCDKLLSDFKNSTFIISLSMKSDDLYMWNMYGDRGYGVMIEFDNCIKVDSIYNTEDYDLEEVCYTDGIKNYPLLRDIYNEGLTKWRSCCNNEQSNKYKEDTISKLFKYLCPSIKSASYEKEEEFRIRINNVPIESIKFRVNNKILIPYIEVPIPVKYLRSITIGPCCDTALSKYTLRYLLNSCGLQHIDIFESNISYRNV